MTAPAAVSSTGPAITIPYQLAQGAPPVRITDGAGNTPAGYTLVNRADHGQTINIAAGPSGTVVPLTAGGTMTWTDPGVFPYASVPAPAGGTTGLAETLIVTNQATGYSNPTAVGVATATQLYAQGVPPAYQSQVIAGGSMGNGVLLPLVPMASWQSLLVTASATLSGAAPGGYVMQPQVLVARFSWTTTTPAGVPNQGSDSPLVAHVLTWDPAIGGETCTWQLPVTAPYFGLNTPQTNYNQNVAYQVIATNRQATAFRQCGDEMGVRNLWASCPDTAIHQLQVASDGVTGAGWGLLGGSWQTRLNGPVVLGFTAVTAGVLRAQWIDHAGRFVTNAFPLSAGSGSFQWAHPITPVRWSFQANTAVPGATCQLTVLQG